MIVFHDKYFQYDPRENFVGRLHVTIQRIALILFNASITAGPSVKKWFEDLHGDLASEMVVIPNGAPNFAPRENSDYSPLREKYNIDTDAFVALFFGAIGFKPNHDAAMYLHSISDSVSQKFKRSTGRSLIFIVAGTDSETLPKTACFVPLGFVNELDELLSLPNVIIFPHLSSFSGPHLKTIYAFLSKKPVIASDDAVKDMPYVTPRIEFLPFDINKPDTLLDPLVELYNNKELGERIALNAYHYSEKFSWKYVSSLYLRLYEKLLS